MRLCPLDIVSRADLQTIAVPCVFHNLDDPWPQNMNLFPLASGLVPAANEGWLLHFTFARWKHLYDNLWTIYDLCPTRVLETDTWCHMRSNHRINDTNIVDFIIKQVNEPRAAAFGAALGAVFALALGAVPPESAQLNILQLVCNPAPWRSWSIVQKYDIHVKASYTHMCFVDGILSIKCWRYPYKSQKGLKGPKITLWNTCNTKAVTHHVAVIVRIREIQLSLRWLR